MVSQKRYIFYDSTYWSMEVWDRQQHDWEQNWKVTQITVDLFLFLKKKREIWREIYPSKAPNILKKKLRACWELNTRAQGWNHMPTYHCTINCISSLVLLQLIILLFWNFYSTIWNLINFQLIHGAIVVPHLAHFQLHPNTPRGPNVPEIKETNGAIFY